jgi:uncharacterized protein (DUF2164 family)
MRALTTGVILLVTFVVAFFAATAFFDTLEWHMGYYKQGVEDSKSAYETYLKF